MLRIATVGRDGLKLSKIPTSFINFDDIRSLPHRQLAYTAHLADQLGMENEDLWIQIRDSFLESFHQMKPKLFTQCLVAVSKRDGLCQRDWNRLSSLVATRADEFRQADLVFLLSVFSSAPLTDSIGPARICDRLSRLGPIESEHQLAQVFSSIGKLKLNHEQLIDNLVSESMPIAHRFSELDIAAIIRSLCSFATGCDLRKRTLVDRLVLDNPNTAKMDAGCLNIVLNGLSKLEKIASEACIDRLFSLLSRAEFKDVSLVPHLLHSASRLAVKEDHMKVCVRLGGIVLRQLNNLKPASLAVALEASRLVKSQNPDMRVVNEKLESVIPRLVDEFLLVASDDDKMILLKSGRCEWLMEKIRASIPVEEVSSSSPPMDVEDNIVSLVSTGEMGRAVERILESKSSKIDDGVYNYLFRSIIQSHHSTHIYLEPLVNRFLSEMRSCTIKTVARCLQACIRTRTEVPSVVLVEVVSRFREIGTGDVCGVLHLLGKAEVSFNDNWEFVQYKDAIEAKLAVELDLVKSYAKRSEIIEAAKSIGLDSPEDLIDGLERALAEERRMHRTIS